MRQPHAEMSGAGLSPTDPSLMRAPLDFLREDHLRERRICAMIDRLVGGAALDRPLAVTVLRFLNEELTVHMRDKVEDLFPLLEKRCVPEDCIERTIGSITTTQRDAMRLLPRVRAALVRCVDTGDGLSARDIRLLARFADHMRRLLVAEHAILLPIARARLNGRDLQVLSRGMRTRRGLSPFQETPDA